MRCVWISDIEDVWGMKYVPLQLEIKTNFIQFNYKLLHCNQAGIIHSQVLFKAVQKNNNNTTRIPENMQYLKVPQKAKTCYWWSTRT